MKYINLALILSLLVSQAILGQGSTGAIAPSVSTNSNTLVGRAPDARGWTDPALNHNRLLRDGLGDARVFVIGTYKVLGSPYLFGVRRNADLFTPKEKAYLIDINYNAYNQEVEFYSTSNPTQPLVKEPGEVDSFIMKQNPDVGLLQDIRFVYGSIIGSNEKAYFQVVQPGAKYALYKRYKSELGYPSSHYSQPELRQFDLTSDYFLHDIKANKLKKLKMNLPAITKEFKSIKDVSAIADKEGFSKNPEDETKKLIDYLNQ